MTIATQGGSLIVKDGKLAENCRCCERLICGCATADNVPPALHAAFSNFSLTFLRTDNFSQQPPGFLPRPENAESIMGDWLSSFRPAIPLVSEQLNQNIVFYATSGCVNTVQSGVQQPCAGCSPSFRSFERISGFPQASLGVQWQCLGGYSLVSDGNFRPRWQFGPAIGCNPSGLEQYMTATFDFSLFNGDAPTFCNIAQGNVTSFEIPLSTSFVPVFVIGHTNSLVSIRHIYTLSGGTVTLSTNPLP